MGDRVIFLPEHPRWGEQTQSALDLFGYGPLPRAFIEALGEVKKAAIIGQIEANSPYPEDYIPCLLEALDEIIRGKWDAHFPLNLRMGSAGTSLYMNINEVLASLSNEKYLKLGGGWKAHFLDHINLYQSTNDVIPSVLSIILYRGLNRIEEEVIALQEALVERENLYDQILILGRTELQDALPMKLGQIFGAWAGAAERDRWRINKLKERCRTIALGGTALGTCFGAPREYVFAAERALREITGLPLSRSQNLPDEIAMQDKTSEVIAGMALCGDNLLKISQDLLLYSSSFMGEIPQESLQYGSTIMAGKSNPVGLEYLTGMAREIRWTAEKVQDHCRSGQLQLNQWIPFILKGALDCFYMLERALSFLARDLLPLLKPDEERIEENLFCSPAMIYALRPWLEYEKIKALAETLRSEKVSPKNRQEWINFLEFHGKLERSFLENFLEGPWLTGFYKKDFS